MNDPELKRPNKSYRALSLIMLVVSVIITIFFAEILFRTLLFSEFSFMQTLKRPEFYANEWDIDFFKLRHFFEQKYKEPSDKMLGWIKSQIIASESYKHVDDVGINGRVPVLLYGDSFAACHTTSEDCFQGILNNNPDFNVTNHLINYGVSGYGVDQVYLLYQHTIQTYRNPIVIVGVMNYDLDRNIMPVTWGLKPYYTCADGKLIYQNSHLVSNVDDFFIRNPPKIRSYLWRLLVHQAPFPEDIHFWLKSLEERKSEIRSIGETIIIEMSKDLKIRNIPNIFVLFEWPKRIIKPPDWRTNLLIKIFRKNNINFIIARDAIVNHELHCPFDWEKYAVEDGHPNYLYNQLVSEQILAWISGLEK